MAKRAPRWVHWLVRALGGVLTFVVVVLFGVTLALQTQPGRDFASTQLMAVLRGVLGTKLEIDRIEHLGVTYGEVYGVRVLGRHGEVVASARRVSLHVNPWALLRNQLSFTSATVSDPIVDLGEPGGAGGGLPDAIGWETPPKPPDEKPKAPDGSALTVHFGKLHAVRGELRMIIGKQVFALTQLDALGDLAIAGELRVRVDPLFGTWRKEGKAVASVRGSQLSYADGDQGAWSAKLDVRSGDAHAHVAAQLRAASAAGLRPFRLDTRVEQLDSSALAAFGLDADIASASAVVAVQGETRGDFSAGSFDAHVVSASYDQLVLPRTTTSGEWSTATGLNLRTIEARYSDAAVSGSLVLAANGRLDVRAKLHAAAVEHLPPAQRFAPQAHGRVDATAHIVLDQDSCAHVRADVTLARAGYGGVRAQALHTSFALFGRDRRNTKLDLNVDARDVSVARVHLPHATLRVVGGPDRYAATGRFTSHGDQDSRGGLDVSVVRHGEHYLLDGAAQLAVEDYDWLHLAFRGVDYRVGHELYVARLRAGYGVSHARASGTLDPNGKSHVRAEVYVPDLQALLQPFVETPIDGSFSALMSLDGSLAKPQVKVDASYRASRVLTLHDIGVDATLQVDFASRQPTSTASVQARFRFDGDPGLTHVALDGHYDPKKLQVAINARDAKGPLVRTQINTALTAFRFSDPRPTAPDFLKSHAWDTTFWLAARRIDELPGMHVLGVNAALFPAQISADAHVQHTPGEPPEAELKLRARWLPEPATVAATCGQTSQPDLAIDAKMQHGLLESVSALQVAGREVLHVTTKSRAPLDVWFQPLRPSPASALLEVHDLRLADLPVVCEQANGVVSGSASLDRALSQQVQLRADLRGSQLRIRHAQPFDAHVSASLDRKMVVAHAKLCSKTGNATITGRLPLDGGGAMPSVRINAPLKGRAELHDVDVPALLSAIPQVTARGGTLAGVVDVTGALNAPLLNGDLTLHDVSLLLPELGQPFEHVNGKVHLRGRTLQLDKTRVRDRDGYADISGTLTLRSMESFNAELELTSNDLPIRRGGVILALLDGKTKIVADITPEATSVGITIRRAAVELTDANLSGVQSLQPNPKIQFVDARAGSTEAESENASKSTTTLTIDASEPFWMRRDDFSVLIATHLKVVLTTGEPTVTGVVEIKRGIVALVGQTFDIDSGRIEFSGGHEVVPTLALTASRKVPGGATVVVDATGTLKTPVLRFTVDGNAVTAGEALAAAAGTRTSNGSGGELQQQVGSVASGIAAGVLTLGARRELGEWVPVLAIETDERETSLRAGVEARRLVPVFLRKVVVDAYVEGILSEAKSGANAATAPDTPQTSAAVLLELRFPHNLVGEGQYGPADRWSADFSWEP